MNNDDLLRFNDLCIDKRRGTKGMLGGICRNTLYSMVERGEFPKPRYIGRIPTWKRGDVLAALDSLPGREAA